MAEIVVGLLVAMFAIYTAARIQLTLASRAVGIFIDVLLCREPVPDTDSNPADPFDAADSGGQFWTEQSEMGGLVGDPPNGRQVQIDRCWCVLFLFEIDPVSEDHGAIEREARF